MIIAQQRIRPDKLTISASQSVEPNSLSKYMSTSAWLAGSGCKISRTSLLNYLITGPHCRHESLWGWCHFTPGKAITKSFYVFTYAILLWALYFMLLVFISNYFLLVFARYNNCILSSCPKYIIRQCLVGFKKIFIFAVAPRDPVSSQDDF